MDLAVGVAVLACGVWLSSVRPLPGVALSLAGVTWFAANVGADPLVFVHRGLVVAAALLLFERRVAAVLVVVSTVPASWMSDPRLALTWAAVVGGLAIAVGRCEPRGQHRALTATTVGGLPLVVGLVTIAMVSPGVANDTVVVLYSLGTMLSALGIAIAAHWLSNRSARITDAVIEVALGNDGPTRHHLAQALRDPGVDLAFVAGSGWIDEIGNPRQRVGETAGRRRMSVTVGEETLAEIACGVELARTSAVREAIENATRLAATNARLRADVRAEALEIDRSRARLLRVEDEARATVARSLDAGVRAPLRELSRPGNRVDEVLRELDRLAAGLGPGALGDGFDEAIRRLAEGTAAQLDLAGRMPPEMETTAYLVVAEALTNSLKHAEATGITISTGEHHVTIADNGRGGATGGLNLLQDRVRAAGGLLDVSSPPGGGTTVVMRF